MTERIRTTISLSPEAYEIFKRMAAAANESVSRTMGDWLTDTCDAATMITLKMEEAKAAPALAMRELQAMVAGMAVEVDSMMGKAREEERRLRHAQRDAGAAPIPPSSNTGGKSPNPSTPKAARGSKK
jgi:hypothetical protein